MRCLNRNKRTIYYALYSGKEAIKDTSGNRPGEWKITYSTPVQMEANVSAAKGTATLGWFGINMDYTKTIVVDDANCPISETTILWIDTMPALSATGATVTVHDYVVTGVARSINGTAYAISKVGAI